MQVGDTLPLYFQLFDYATDKFIKAFVRNQLNSEIAGAPVNLAQLALGIYFNKDLTFPVGTAWVTVQYIVYDDAGYTQVSQSEGAGYERFDLTTGGGGGSTYPPTTNIVAVVQSDGCSQLPIQDTIIKGSDRTIIVRLVQDSGGDPFDLATASEIEFRFRNTDGTILSLKESDGGSPVQVVSAAAGKVLCKLTDVQTALLAARIPAPFSIVVTATAGKTIINVGTQLAIEDKDV